MILIIILLLLALGFIVLFYGAKLVVISLENISNRLGISHLMVGLTVLAIGTSLPEIAVSVAGGFDKLYGISHDIDGIVIGNKIGSFLTNITLILGILGLSQKIFVSRWELKREGIMLFVSIFFFLIIAIDLIITRIEALILIASYFIYLAFIIRSEKKLEQDLDSGLYCCEDFRLDPHCLEIADCARETSSAKVDIGLFLLGLVILIIGAEITILSAVSLGDFFNIPSNVIGILVVGLGTSLPELVADLTALRRESHGIAVGDILGSNICNTLLATGAGAVISEFSVPPVILYFDIPMLLIATSISLYFLWTARTLKRWEAAFLIGFYGFYAFLKIFFFQI
jgi:cation:H+ antiporter